MVELKEGLKILFDWLLKEFSDLKEVIYTTFDNSAVLTCESLLALLEHVGCEVYKKVGAKELFFHHLLSLEMTSRRFSQ
jgi:hypothetical protein